MSYTTFDWASLIQLNGNPSGDCLGIRRHLSIMQRPVTRCPQICVDFEPLQGALRHSAETHCETTPSPALAAWQTQNYGHDQDPARHTCL